MTCHKLSSLCIFGRCPMQCPWRTFQRDYSLTGGAASDIAHSGANLVAESIFGRADWGYTGEELALEGGSSRYDG